MRSLVFLIALACAPKAPPAGPGPDAPAAAGNPAAGTPAAGNPAAGTPAAGNPTMLPTPYTAEQIRDAMPAGALLRFRVEQPGQPAIELRWTVTSSDAQGCTLRSEIYDPSTGALIEDGGDETHAWTELREHAAFPAEGTAISQSELDLPMGRYRVTVYRVIQGDKTVDFHFAPDLPGPPVLMVASKGDQEEKRMTMIERSPLPGAPATP